MDFFDATKTGDLSSRLSADCNKMSDQIGLNINVFLRSVVQAVGLLVFMFYSQWQLTVVTFMSVPLVTVVSRVYGTYYRAIAEAVQDQQAACNAAAEEIIGCPARPIPSCPTPHCPPQGIPTRRGSRLRRRRHVSGPDRGRSSLCRVYNFLPSAHTPKGCGQHDGGSGPWCCYSR